MVVIIGLDPVGGGRLRIGVTDQDLEGGGPKSLRVVLVVPEREPGMGGPRRPAQGNGQGPEEKSKKGERQLEPAAARRGTRQYRNLGQSMHEL